ncbi:class I SAM-dependent methyltransferase [Parvibaculum sp.]|uniref:class I SAM-dependent methyltransferase n=1 Tax=Parvibaculum sp. TaxID=2024848 RepID=UPI00349FEE41
MNDSRLRRHRLGFLEAAEKPTPEELQRYYAEQYYQAERGNYRKSYPQAERDYLNLKIAQKAALVMELRAGQGPGTMLDVGCGEGFALAWFQERGWQVEGLDHSVAGVESMHPGMLPHVEAGDVFERLRQRITEGRRFDLVWLTHVLEHVLDPVALLTDLRSLVSPAGVLVVTVPNDGSAYQESLFRQGEIQERFWIALPDHLAYFTLENLRQTAEATGWSCRDIVGDFPIDFFLMHEGSNYVKDRSKGPAAHRARIGFELLLGEFGHERVNEFYRALAHVGLGRSLTAFLTPA